MQLQTKVTCCKCTANFTEEIPQETSVIETQTEDEYFDKHGDDPTPSGSKNGNIRERSRALSLSPSVKESRGVTGWQLAGPRRSKDKSDGSQGPGKTTGRGSPGKTSDLMDITGFVPSQVRFNQPRKKIEFPK